MKNKVIAYALSAAAFAWIWAARIEIFSDPLGAVDLFFGVPISLMPALIAWIVTHDA